MAELEGVYAKQYGSNVYTLAQQKGSVLRPYVTQEDMKGEKVHFDVAEQNYRDKYIPKMQERFDIHTRLDRNDLTLQDDLRGKKYTTLSLDERRSFLTAAETNRNKLEMQEDQRVLAELADGNFAYTDEELSILRDNGDLSDRQYHLYKGWFNASLERDMRKKEEVERKEEEKKRQESIQANQALKALETARQEELDKLFLNAEFDDKGFAKKLSFVEFNKAYQKIREVTRDNPKMAGIALKRLNGLLEKQENFDYRESPLYLEGAKMLKLFGADKEKGFLAEGRFGRNASDDSAGAKYWVERGMRIELETFVQNHPDATEKELYEHLKTKLDGYHRTQLFDIVGQSMLQKMLERADPMRNTR